MENNSGYQEDFLGDCGLKVPLLPMVEQTAYDLAELKGQPDQYVLNYQNYSVIMDKQRKFPIVAASNVDGTLFKKAKRKGSWKLEKRINREYQWGRNLYSAEKSDFDKGHLTKREDVQWGMDEASAIEAAKSTFYYTNSVPQHPQLNRAVWRSIEDYILKSEAVKHSLKVVVMTGPVLHEMDPTFVTLVKDQAVQIPLLFWKLIYYTKGDGKLYRTAFLVSQRELMEREEMVKKTLKSRSTDVRDVNYFHDYKNAETYQVQVNFVKELTGLHFPDAHEEFRDERPAQLILQEVKVRGEVSEDITERIWVKNLVF